MHCEENEINKPAADEKWRQSAALNRLLQEFDRRNFETMQWPKKNRS